MFLNGPFGRVWLLNSPNSKTSVKHGNIWGDTGNFLCMRDMLVYMIISVDIDFSFFFSEISHVTTIYL